MRILIFCPTWGELGGIERIGETLADAFVTRGHTVAVLARGRSSAGAGKTGHVAIFRLPFRGVPHERNRIRRRMRYAISQPLVVARSRRLVERWRADAVLSLSVSTYAAHAAALARSAPLVFSVQSGGPDFVKHPIPLRKAFERAVAVAACARSLVQAVRMLAPAARVELVPNGVDVNLFSPAGPCYSHPRPYVLATGRFTRQKGFDVLLRAFAQLAAVRVDLLLVGDGIDRGALKRLSEQHGLPPRIHFLPPMSPVELAAVYRGACLTACPSRWEGLPLVALEAMACGSPVVGSTVDGIPDAVIDGETGLTVPVEDAQALANAIDRLLADDTLRRQLSTQARAVALERFAWPSIVDRYLELLGRSPSGCRPAGRGL